MRCWRLPDGGVLVEAPSSRAPAYHHLVKSRVVRSYWPQFADDCELLYTFGHRVVGSRFESCRTVEVGYPFRQEVTAGEGVFDQLVELPDGTVSAAELTGALGLPPLIEAVYAAFDSCPKPARVAGCPHCRPSDSDCELLRDPARLLTPETLDPYLYTAITTWGTAGDFRYFAPRILALAVTEQFPDINLEIVLGKFRLAGWLQWPAAQLGSVSALFEHYWTLSLAAYPGPRPIDEVLCALGNAVDDVQPMLDRWVEHTTAPAAPTADPDAAARHLRDFVAGGITEARRKHRLSNGFWRARPGQQAQVLDWLLSPELRGAVEAAFYRADGTPAADPLAETHELLGP
jgi:hypothetical protein